MFFFRLYVFFLLGLWCFPQLQTFGQSQSKELFEAGKSLYEQKKYSKAREYFQDAVNKDPKQYGGKGNYHIALSYVKQKNCLDAKEYFAKAFKQDSVAGGASSKDKFIEQLSKCNFSINDLKIESGNQPQITPPQKNIDPTFAKQWFQRGKIAYDQKNYPQAINYFQLAYLSDTAKYGAKACYQIALCYKKQKNCNSAKPFLAKAQKIEPNKGGASSAEKFQEFLTYCHFTVDDLKKSNEPVFQVDDNLDNNETGTSNSLEITPDYNGLMRIGNNLLEKQQYDSAAVIFAQAAEVCINTELRIRTFVTLAQTYIKLRNCAEAFKAYSNAYRLDFEEYSSSLLANQEPEESECKFSRNELLVGRRLSAFEKAQLHEPIIWSYVPFIAAAFIVVFIIAYKRKLKLSSEPSKVYALNHTGTELTISAELTEKMLLIPERERNQLLLLFKIAFNSIREVWQFENNAAQRTQNALKYFAKLDSIWEKFNEQPIQFIEGKKSNELVISLLLLTHKEDWYCYFSGQYLGEKAKILQIRHPVGEKISVWASKSTIEKVNTKQPVKVRIHKIVQDGVPTWVHWSQDPTFFNWDSTPEKNTDNMQQWTGESKNVLPETIPNIIFKPTLYYNYPHPESIFTESLIIEEKVEPTGYQGTNKKNYEENTINTVQSSDVYITHIPNRHHHQTHRDDS